MAVVRGSAGRLCARMPRFSDALRNRLARTHDGLAEARPHARRGAPPLPTLRSGPPRRPSRSKTRRPAHRRRSTSQPRPRGSRGRRWRGDVVGGSARVFSLAGEKAVRERVAVGNSVAVTAAATGDDARRRQCACGRASASPLWVRARRVRSALEKRGLRAQRRPASPPRSPTRPIAIRLYAYSKSSTRLYSRPMSKIVVFFGFILAASCSTSERE